MRRDGHVPKERRTQQRGPDALHADRDGESRTAVRFIRTKNGNQLWERRIGTGQ